MSMVESSDSTAWLTRAAAAPARWSGEAAAKVPNPLRTRAARLLRSSQTWAAVVGFRSSGMPRSVALDKASASAATTWALDDHCVRCRLRANRKYSPAITAAPTTTMITITTIRDVETLLLVPLVAAVVVVDELVVVTGELVVVTGAVVTGVVGGAVVTGAVVTGAVVTGAVVAGRVVALCADA